MILSAVWWCYGPLAVGYVAKRLILKASLEESLNGAVCKLPYANLCRTYCTASYQAHGRRALSHLLPPSGPQTKWCLIYGLWASSLQSSKAKIVLNSSWFQRWSDFLNMVDAVSKCWHLNSNRNHIQMDVRFWIPRIPNLWWRQSLHPHSHAWTHLRLTHWSLFLQSIMLLQKWDGGMVWRWLCPKPEWWFLPVQCL